MRLTTTQQNDRNLKIQSAINILEKSNQELSVAMLAQYTEFSLPYLYQHPLVRDRFPLLKEGHSQVETISSDSPTNSNFIQIIKSGYQLQTTVGRKNTARIYLIKDGIRVHYIEFKANGKNTRKLIECIPHARYFTAVDKAMVQALQWIEQQ